MAVTKTHPIKSTLKAAIDYICNPEKTDGKLLVSAYGCAAETADIEFAWTRRHAIDRLLPGCHDLEELLVRLQREGYALKRGKYISARAPGQERFTRLKTLGADYAEDALTARMAVRSADAGRNGRAHRPEGGADRRASEGAAGGAGLRRRAPERGGVPVPAPAGAGTAEGYGAGMTPGTNFLPQSAFSPGPLPKRQI